VGAFPKKNDKMHRSLRSIKAIFIYQAMTLTKDSVLWNGLPQSGNIASPTFGEKIRNPLNLSLNLHLSNMSDLILRQLKMHYRIVIYSLNPPWGQKNNGAHY
jgi:hypothetical protein